MSTKRPPRNQRINEILKSSQMQIDYRRDSQGYVEMLMRISGTAAKLPSTTNNRMISIPAKIPILKMINSMIAEPRSRSSVQLEQLKGRVMAMRAMITKNPAHLEQLEALTLMYQHITVANPIHFDTSTTKRCALLMLLSPDLNRHDSHNIPKAVCDWLAEMKVFNNDRHVDAFARRKTDCGFPGQSSDILLVRYDKAIHCVDALFADMVTAINRVTGVKHATQENLNLN